MSILNPAAGEPAILEALRIAQLAAGISSFAEHLVACCQPWICLLSSNAKMLCCRLCLVSNLGDAGTVLHSMPLQSQHALFYAGLRKVAGELSVDATTRAHEVKKNQLLRARQVQSGFRG